MHLLYDKKASIGGKKLDVINYDSYGKYKDVVIENGSAAVEVKVNEDSFILPVRTTVGANMDKPGLYVNQNSPIHFLSFPKTEEEKELYCPSKEKILDYNDIATMQKCIEEKEKLDFETNRALEASDNKTIPPIKESDTPTMRALKEAIIAKNMDIDMYKERFGENFPNDKRKLNDDNVTLFILERYCQCLDMEADIILRDAPGNIANPMNKVVTANIFPGNVNNVTITDVSDKKEESEEE